MNIKPVVLIAVVLIAVSAATAQDTSASTDTAVLSDTHGYDISRYMEELTNRVRYNWYSIMPDVARREKGKVVVHFMIIRDGKVQDLRLVASSNVQPLDRAATGAIQLSSPFSPFPPDFKGEHLLLQFSFFYNMKSEKQ